MSYDDPNREAIGLAPIWTGADAEPEPPAEPEIDPELEQTEPESDDESEHKSRRRR